MNEATENPIPALDTIERVYFSPSELDKAQEAINDVLAITNHHGVPITRNFNIEEDFPARYGLVILPINKRVEGKGNETIGVCIGAVPDPELIAESEGGADFIRSTILNAEIAKLANSVRPRGDNDETSSSIPLSVHDFITSLRAGESMLTFRKLAPVFVKALKGKGIKYMTAVLLRQLFQSAAFAEAQFPKVPQEQWLLIIDAMIAKAKADKLDVTVLQNWKETRAQAPIETGEIDLSDLGDLA